MLDLLRVVSHHRARLATPIRTVQKIYADTEIEKVPFSETIFTRARAAATRPFLLIESPSRINGDDKAKAHSARSSEEQELKVEAVSDSKDETSSPSDGSVQNSSDNKQPKKANSGDVHPTSAKTDSSSGTISVSTPPNLQPEGQDLGRLNSGENALQRAASVMPAVTISEPGTEKSDNPLPNTTAHSKHQSEKLPVARPLNARSTLEENIVLGVALEGSKRVLPIEEGMAPSPTPAEMKELAAFRNSNGTSSTEKESQISSAPGGAGDLRDQER